MRYYLDTEFIEHERTMDLISIGVVAQDGREFYAISLEFDPAAASDWIREHVLVLLEPRESGVWKSRAAIRDELVAFIGDDPPEFWTWCGLYDWLAVVQLFGGLDRLPTGWLYFANDLMQWCGQLGLSTEDPRIPRQVERQHHALADARHNRVIYEFLAQYQQTWLAEQARANRRGSAAGSESLERMA